MDSTEKLEKLQPLNRDWAKEVSEWLLLNPTRTLGDCALDFGVSPVFIHTLVRSDSFKEIFKDTKKNYFFSVKEGLRGLASMSLEKIKEQIEVYGTTLKPETLAHYLDLALKYSESQGAAKGPAVVVQFNEISGDVLSTARARMRAVRGEGAEDAVLVEEKEGNGDGPSASTDSNNLRGGHSRALVQVED